MHEGIPAAVNPANDLDVTLDWIATNYRADNLVISANNPTVSTPCGVLGIDGPYEDKYEDPDAGEYIRVGFCLSEGMYAEIEDGTYGQLNAFRIYKNTYGDIMPYDNENE